MNTYTKLRDGWGVRATQPVVVGQEISVRTRAGVIKTETVAKVLWVGPDADVIDEIDQWVSENWTAAL